MPSIVKCQMDWEASQSSVKLSAVFVYTKDFVGMANRTEVLFEVIRSDMKWVALGIQELNKKLDDMDARISTLEREVKRNRRVAKGSKRDRSEEAAILANAERVLAM